MAVQTRDLGTRSEGFVLLTKVSAKGEKSYLDKLSDAVEGISSELRDISLSIHDNPELQYKEFHAHRVLTEYLSRQDGWNVTPSAYGIDTAFVAVFDSGKAGPVVSYNAEYGGSCSIVLSQR